MELVIVPIVATILVVWFYTDAFVEYGSLLGLGKLLKIDAFLKAQKKDMSLIFYYMYLNSKYNNFFTKLLICPFCVGFWVTVTACLAFSYYNVCLIYIASLVTFYTIGVLIKYS
jgi:hypothetical protein